MKIAIIENNIITAHGEYTEVFPNVSFPQDGLDLMWAQERNAYQIQSDRTRLPTQKLTSVEPYIENGVVYDVIVEDKTQDELDAENTQKANEVRYRRNGLLTQSDWTQVADAPVDKASWAVYRQALRDITLQAGFPFAVDFPVAP
ncbi:MAG: tail fiber assembly protein [Fluviibacter sp.]